jgi:hypothetical protein
MASNVPTLYCTAMIKIITVRSPYHPTQAIPSIKNPTNIVASSPSLLDKQQMAESTVKTIPAVTVQYSLQSVEHCCNLIYDRGVQRERKKECPVLSNAYAGMHLIL